MPYGLPPPDRIVLQDLSPSLKIALESGGKSTRLFNQTLKECEIFYSKKYPSIVNSACYQAIGETDRNVPVSGIY